MILETEELEFLLGEERGECAIIAEEVESEVVHYLSGENKIEAARACHEIARRIRERGSDDYFSQHV